MRSANKINQENAKQSFKWESWQSHLGQAVDSDKMGKNRIFRSRWCVHLVAYFAKGKNRKEEKGEVAQIKTEIFTEIYKPQKSWVLTR